MWQSIALLAVVASGVNAQQLTVGNGLNPPGVPVSNTLNPYIPSQGFNPFFFLF
jgi:hypothetical protein